jgi:hypothetical protein
MMLAEITKLRADTLANNLIWLESFGCEISRHDGAIYIAHPKLPEYCAWLIVGARGEALERIRAVADGLDPGSAAPYIYVDEAAGSPELRALLGARHFAPTLVNVTKAGVWTPRAAPTDVLLRPASPGETALWASLYSEGFGRSGSDAEKDRARWEQSLKGGRVRHWFLLRGEEAVGVCQTCAASGVVGIYSFTLKPSARNAYHLRSSLRALRAGLTSRGEITFYFERLWNRGSDNRQRITQATRRLTVVRKMVGYRRANT